jgi:hypothetical protein
MQNTFIYFIYKLNQGFVIVEFLKFYYANPWLNRDAEKSH